MDLIECEQQPAVPPGAVRGPARAGAYGVVAIHALREADSPRLKGPDPEHIARLAESEAAVPPILVHRQTMRVIDGMHRLRAAVSRGDASIEVEYFDGSEADAFLESVSSNTAHGLPLSMADRKAAAERIVKSHPNLSDRAVARCAGLSGKTVAAIRRSRADIPQVNIRLGGDGRRQTVDASAGRLRAAAVITGCPGATLRDVAREAGISLGTAKDVRDRLSRGASPVLTPGPGDRAAAPAAAPGARTRAARPRAGVPTDEPGARLVLERLGRDPAVHSTESGRELLRWLNVHAAALRKWPELLSALPPHCVDSVAVLVRTYSDSWIQLLDNLEQEERDSVRVRRPRAMRGAVPPSPFEHA